MKGMNSRTNAYTNLLLILLVKIASIRCDNDENLEVNINQICIDDCPPEWVTTIWSPCSRSCGQGWNSRNVTCMSSDHLQHLTPDQCKINMKPVEVSQCNNGPCNPIADESAEFRQVLLNSDDDKLKTDYDVEMTEDADSSHEEFSWKYRNWTPCSATCAGGTQSLRIACSKVGEEDVDDSYCDNVQMLPIKVRQCNSSPCPARWVRGEWAACSRTCGGGHRTRLITCMQTISQTTDLLVQNSECLEKKPKSIEICNEEHCPPEWLARDWSPCSHTCGRGWNSRLVSCMSSDHKVMFNDSKCKHQEKPITRTQCNNGACPPARWRISKWSGCSATCGKGKRRRLVTCRQAGRVSNQCARPAPQREQSCEVPCTFRACVDDTIINYCHLVQKFRFCDRAYFRARCCATCSQ